MTMERIPTVHVNNNNRMDQWINGKDSYELLVNNTKTSLDESMVLFIYIISFFYSNHPAVLLSSTSFNSVMVMVI